MSCGHEHHGDHPDHDHDDEAERGIQYSLYKHIDTEHVEFLNVPASHASPAHIFKPYPERFHTDTFVKSDDDWQFIVKIPFTGSVKLKAIAVLGLGQHSPRTMKAYVNRQDIDFSSVDSIEPDQSWDLMDPQDQNRSFIPEYETRISKFSGVQVLTLFFPDNFTAHEDEATMVSYIGLRGEWKELNRNPIITVYELNANPADHKTKANAFGSTNMIQ